jgi:hypothetical protein
MIATIYPGTFGHEDDEGRSWHLDRQLSREQFEILVRAVTSVGLGPSEVCAVHFHAEAPPTITTVEMVVMDARRNS